MVVVIIVLISCKENPEGWMPNFVEIGGISALIELVEKLSIYDPAHRSKFPEYYITSDSQILECLSIFKLLLDSAARSVLIISDSINCIALNYDHPETDIKQKALDILEFVCTIPPVGPPYALSI